MIVAQPIAERAADVRRFNRFYTKQIGILTDSYLKSPFSLPQARVVYELAHHGQTTATELGSELDLDAGYLSRILRDLQKGGWVGKQPSKTDGRRTVLRLTDKGQQAFASINAASQRDIEAMLNKLSEENQRRLTQAMFTIEQLLGAPPERQVPYILRPHQPGDMGWVVQCHGVVYSQEYGWSEDFEGLAASIVAKFIQHHDPKRERCWIAEKDGERVGSVFLVRKTDRVAKLRLLIVEPKARGLGIGSRLVDECLRFARQAGYRQVTLWTNSILVSARHIYEKAGFRLTEEEPHHSFGHDLVGETWDLRL
ncbi:MAG: bifunctional helix-turn-helix transcriptional regulator/GNAT family N-acetyltransferase [Chloroflexi bacterium]|nr:bifunctional helix-turn-helix transcriptional regulator/GNAT family N-acetyltransferase [Chloroflexota bacterium]